MKIVHLTTTDYGGAYRAAANISLSMRQQGMESVVVVREKNSDEDVVPVMNTGFRLFLSRARNYVNLLASKGDIINDPLGKNLLNVPEIQEADVYVLHWVNSFLSYRMMERFFNTGKPVLCVMHDMWLFTGGCHYDGECGRYRERCGRCPILGAKRDKDLSRRIMRRKEALFSHKWNNVTVIGCSEWITDCARSSHLLGTQKIICIKNPVNTDIFHPMEREGLRRKYGIHPTKKLILFSAMIPGDSRKGFDLLSESIKGLDETYYELLIVGGDGKVALPDEKMKIHGLGSISSPSDMAEIYNLADVYVIPSRQENLSNAVTEALSCGIPVTAFAVGGMKDMIHHKENGYLAAPFDKADLQAGIRWSVEQSNYTEISRLTKKEFGMEIIGKEYKELCERVIQQSYPS